MPPRRAPRRAPRRMNINLNQRRAVVAGARQFRRTAFNPMPVFTETYKAPRITANVGGQFTTVINQLPQVAQYSALYNQYKILSVKVMLLPTYTSYDGSAPGAGYKAPRITYAINDTPGTPVPVSEAVILTDNGCRIRTLDKKLAIRFKPVPAKETEDGGVYVREATKPWLSFAQAGQVDPTHWGVDYWISADSTGGEGLFFDVYYKVTFQLRDPK